MAQRRLRSAGSRQRQRLAVSPLDGFFTVILMNGAYTPANRAEGERFLRLCLNAAYAAFQHETGCEDCE